MIKLSRNESFNITDASYKSNSYLKIELAVFKDGLVSKLKQNNFTVLLTVYSFIDENYKPTLRQISNRCGLSVAAVKQCINELMIFELQGELPVSISCYL